MSLSTTLSIAQSALSTNAALSTIVSRNIAGVNNPNYSSKTGQVETTRDGGVKLTGVRSATDTALFSNLLSANSDAASASALSDGLGTLEQSLGLSTTTGTDGTSTDTSPATLLGNLTNALQQYAASPSNTTLGTAAVTAAKTLATNLNSASATVQGVREQADSAMATSVATINSLLGQFGAANTAVTNATLAGTDATDAIDSRNAILQSLSSEIGISTADAGNGSLAIYTDGGATLFQGSARTVAFTATPAFSSSTVGGAVTVDGVAVTGVNATMASKSGKIAGLAQLRDTTAVAYGNQLDQIAQGLVQTFSESSNGTSVPGLFTYAGGNSPAQSITVPSAVDPSRNGNATLLRDGVIHTGAASSTAAAGDATQLNAYIKALTNPDPLPTFNSNATGVASGTLASYATASVSWLETTRQAASTASTNKTALVTQTTTNLSSVTGVNLDEQLSKMLDLEHSYQASAELITTVKSMLDALLSAVN